jgi:hypothetical protein
MECDAFGGLLTYAHDIEYEAVLDAFGDQLVWQTIESDMPRQNQVSELVIHLRIIKLRESNVFIVN